MPDTPTADPDIVIESKRKGYVRYRRLSDGRRWEVFGECDYRGDCIVGAYEPQAKVVIRDKAHIEQLKAQLGIERLISQMDTPVTPEFSTCCGIDKFTYKELPKA